MKELLAQYECENREVWVHQSNSTIWRRDMANDSCYKAAWLVKNYCANYDMVSCLGYSMITDFDRELSAFQKAYHGGYGLTTYNGIPKSGWRALELLDKLGSTLIARGDGWIITSDDVGVQIMLTHYCHYDDLHRMRYQSITDPESVYDIFVKSNGINISLNILGMSSGSYRVEEYRINPLFGSSFDQWITLGKPDHLNTSEITYLKERSVPEYKVTQEKLDGEYILEMALQPHEVRMLLLKRME